MPELTLGRRRTLQRIAAILAGTGTALGIGYAGSRPSAALEADDRFLADDVRVERNGGELDAVTIAPAFELAWADSGGGVEAVEVTISAALDGRAGEHRRGVIAGGVRGGGCRRRVARSERAVVGYKTVPRDDPIWISPDSATD